MNALILMGAKDFCCLIYIWEKNSGLKVCREIDLCGPLKLYTNSIGHESLSFKLKIRSRLSCNA